MKKNVLLCVTSFILGAILFSATPVKAAVQEFICYQADYKLYINDKLYSDKDLPLLNYKGYTVCSVRKILEFAGFEVNYDAVLKRADANYVKEEDTKLEDIITGDTETPINQPDNSNGDASNIVMPVDDDRGTILHN